MEVEQAKAYNIAIIYIINDNQTSHGTKQPENGLFFFVLNLSYLIIFSVNMKHICYSAQNRMEFVGLIELNGKFLK